MSDHGEYVMFSISDLQKTSRPGHDIQKVKFSSFSYKIYCVLHTLRFFSRKNKRDKKNKQIISFI